MFFDLVIGHPVDMSLPGMMVPGMDADFMTGVGTGFDDIAETTADPGSRPHGSHQENVHAIKAGSFGAEHFPQKGWFQQTPDMTAHIIRSGGEEKRCPDPVFVQDPAEIRHSVAGAPEGVYIDPECDLHFLQNSPDSTA